jgi:hypothetical protein
MASKLTISLSGVPQENSFIELRVGFLNNIRETFKDLRISPFQSSIGNDTSITTFALYSAIVADYNISNLFVILYNVSNNSISIEHPDEDFFKLEYVNDQTGGLLNFSVENTANPVVIDFQDVSFSTSDVDTCGNIKVTITTNVLAVKYKINRIEYPNINNPFTLDLLRSSLANITIEGFNGTTSQRTLDIPSNLVTANISVSYVNSPSGATVNILVTDTNLLELEYSLDNVNWQSNNSYSGILPGNYPSLVRDQFGCITLFNFTIPEFSEGGVGQRIPYSDLPSKSNSIRFAKYVDWGNCSNYKNDENTLSCQLPYTENALEYNQLFQNCDVITTQVKTNYRDIVVTVISLEDGEPIYDDIPVIKKSNNTDLKDCRTALVYDLADLGVQTGIYFMNGNICDYDTGLPTSDSYVLNGNLPQWGVIGNFVFVFGGWYEIVNIVYDETKSAYVIVIDYNYSGLESSVVVKSSYSIEKYDIWEFSINMDIFKNRKIQVNITQNDSDNSFEEQVYISEIIDVKETHEDAVLIEYYNDENTDMFYGTGIKNKIRLPIEFFSGNFSDVTDSEKTDRETYLINAQSYENDLIAFKLMPKQIMRKVIQALSHKFVFLNEVQYVKEDSPEVVHLVGTNQYRVNAQMTKSDAVYTSKGTGSLFNAGSLEIPSLLEIASGGYLKIKQ